MLKTVISHQFSAIRHKRHCDPAPYGAGVAISFLNRFLAALGMTGGWLFMALPVYAQCQPGETSTDFGCISNDPLKFATSIYGIGLGLIGVIGLLSIIYGAFLVLTSQGDPIKLQNGRSYIVYALIGMGLAVGGFAFYRIIATNVIKLPGFS
mgnify:FL=1